MAKKKPLHHFRLLKLPIDADLISNKIDSLEKEIEKNCEFHHLDHLLIIVFNKLYFLDTENYHELDVAADKISEARHWLKEFMGESEQTCQNERKESE